jgi:WD40 repeat protein
MHKASVTVFRLGRAVLAALVPLGVLSAGCGDDDRAQPPPTGGSEVTPPPISNRCLTPNTGCSCPEQGLKLDCGKVTEVHDDYVTCSSGTRTCSDGTWSECIGERVTQKALDVSAGPNPRLLSLGVPAQCPAGFDTCDPYCNHATDTPDQLPADPGFSVTPGGMTLVETLIVNCQSLTLTPSTSTVTLTGTSLSTLSAPPVTFTLAASPSGCIPAPFSTTWTIDRFDRASISGSDNSDGSLTIAVPIAGTIRVTAFAAGLNTSTNISVKVNVLEAPTTTVAAAPNQPATSAQLSAFGSAASPAAGSGASSAAWLYPYADTYFPLAIPAPTGQYQYTYASDGIDSTVEASAVKLSLRYPEGATATGATFNYSLAVKERNSIVCNADATKCNFVDPQIIIPELAWDYLEQTARGQNAELIVQRLRRRTSGADQLELEQRRRIHFVDGQLKGTVYYGSYNSPQGGNTGAILSIAPGATAPTLAVQPSGSCTTCHTINLQGTKLITNGAPPSNLDTSKRYSMTGAAGASPPVLQTYTSNRFTYGAPWVDGDLYLSHGGSSAGDANWHAPSGASGLYNVSAPDTLIPISNWPTDVQAVTPRFSPDGSKLAFGFWSGSSIVCSSGAASPCTGTTKKLPAAAAGTGTRLAVVDFSCSSPPCTSASTGWRVTNARDLTPGVTERIGWPSFTPDGASVVYQRQYRGSKSGLVLLNWAQTDIGTIAGALSELWISKVPADGSTAAVPTRLLALNGLSSTGTTYLPQQSRTIHPVTLFEMSQTVSSGTAGPAVTLTGTANVSALDVVLDIRGSTSQARGTAKFQYSTDNGATYNGTDITTAATVALGTTGLTASFPNTSNYNPNSLYKAVTARVAVTGTPTNQGQVSVRIKLQSTGVRGTARFQYSINGGALTPSTSPYLTTGASVALGSTGLTAAFADLGYSYDSSWAYTASIPNFHADNSSYTIKQADNCSNTGTLTGVLDYRMNYMPSVAPTSTGGKSWVVFTSRRMYGNVAVQDPFDAEPSQSCSSREVPTKKLWVSAIDDTWTPGTDPSHPAFYIPGQELAAGNSNGYWVSEACKDLGSACSSDDDCCGGTGSSPSTQCRVQSTASFPPVRQCTSRNICAAEGSSCSTTSECCQGLTCPSGGGLCIRQPRPLFETQVYPREYQAVCPADTLVKWRFFEWQSIIPTGTSIEFFVQTKKDAADAYAPAVSLLSSTAATTSNPGVWLRGSKTVDETLAENGLLSSKYLLVTMVFNPNANGSAAPTLTAWRQIYDCVPAQ